MSRLVLTRRHYWLLASLAAATAVYGSLVPFDFQALPFGEALLRFRQLPYLSLGIDSRADFVANILLFVPIGYLLLAAFRTDRVRWAGHFITSAFVIVVGFGFAAAIEFMQAYFPPRTTSLNDVIAESAGAAIGVTAWLLIGKALTEWLRGFLTSRDRLGFIEGLLLIYCAGFLVSQMMPFDLTINLGQLAEKYREGRIEIAPFSHAYDSTWSLLWDLGTDVFLSVPIGITAALLTRRPSWTAQLAVATAFIAATECFQVFVYSRFATSADVIVASCGGGMGILAAHVVWPGHRYGESDNATAITGGMLWSRVLLGLFAAFLIVYHWYPFQFSFEADHIRAGLQSLLTAPFGGYYFGTEFNAFTQGARKALLGLVLGVVARMSFPRAAVWLPAVASGAFLSILELVQILVPGRVADFGDVLMGLAGVAIGLWIRSRF